MSAGNRTALWVLTMLLLPTVIGVAIFAGSLSPRVPVDARSTASLATPKPLPAVNLIRADTGDSFETDDLRDQWTLLYSGYLNCPDLCPTTLAGFADIARAGNNPPAFSPSHPLQLAFVSIDYHRDAPAAMTRYTKHFHPSIVPLTGEPLGLRAFTRALGFIAPPKTQTATVGHSSAIALINPNAELHALFRYPHNFNDIRALLSALPTPAEGT